MEQRSEVHGQQARMIACGTEAKAIIDSQLEDPMQLRKGFDDACEVNDEPTKQNSTMPTSTRTREQRLAKGGRDSMA
jgi:hypothetical protein